ncbi:MAG: hypothetical protein AB1641_03705 [Thermodesulfobacteriota bacterium]
MARIMFFVDGFNVYHSLKRNYPHYLWLNYHALASCYVTSRQSLQAVFYFTALAWWKPASTRRHGDFIAALEDAGVKTVLGRFKEKERFCPNCNQWFTGHEEKDTNVNLALFLYRQAHLDAFSRRTSWFSISHLL